MLRDEISLLKVATRLIKDFQSSESSPIKQEILQTGLYREGGGKYRLNDLLSFLVTRSPVFNKLYFKNTATPQVNKYVLKRSPTEIEAFLSDCYWKGQNEYNRWLNKLSSLSQLTSEELQYIRSVDEIPENTSGLNLFKQLLNKRKTTAPIKKDIPIKTELKDVADVMEEEDLTGGWGEKPTPSPSYKENVLPTPPPPIIENQLRDVADTDEDDPWASWRSEASPTQIVHDVQHSNAVQNASSQAQIKTRKFLYGIRPLERIKGLFRSVFGGWGSSALSGSYPINSKQPNNLSAPSVGQKATSYASRQAKRLIARYGTPRMVASLASSLIGSVFGFSASGTLFGAAGGGIVGFAFPNFLTNKITGQAGLRIMAGGGKMALSAGAKGIGLVSGVGTIPTIVIMALTSKKVRKIGKWAIIGPIAAFFIIAVILMPGGMNFFNTSAQFWGEKGEAAELPPPNVGGDIASCTFYRSGDPTPGLKFRITEWPALISDVASRVGVPPAILAGILRVECPTCFYSDNPEYIKNDYDATSNGFAYGLMQFYPPTFEGVFNGNKSEMASLFGKTSVKTSIDPQSSMAPIDVLRIYSIKDSLTAAAFKVKTDAGVPPPYDRAAIDRVVKAYFTQCDYTQGGGTYSYCGDLWRSYSECQSSSPPIPPVTSSKIAYSCPVDSGNIDTFSNYMSGVPDYKRHCSQAYMENDPYLRGICAQFKGTYYAIDVGGQNGQNVYIPQVFDSSSNAYKPMMSCRYMGASSGSYNSSQIITQFNCTDEINNKSVWLQYHHMNRSYGVSPGSIVRSGDVAGRMAADSYPHAHIQMGIDRGGGNACGSGGIAGCVRAEEYIQCAR